MRVADRIARYRDLQRSVPGLEGIYEIVQAILAEKLTAYDHVLIIWAGGCPEIEVIHGDKIMPNVTAVDPAADNLRGARLIAERLGIRDEIEFIEGTLQQLPAERVYDLVTSLLVTHTISGRTAKLDYLKATRGRIKSGGYLVLADICIEASADVELLKSLYCAHAARHGVAADNIGIEMNSLSRPGILTPSKFRGLREWAGWARPAEVFRTLW